MVRFHKFTSSSPEVPSYPLDLYESGIAPLETFAKDIHNCTWTQWTWKPFKKIVYIGKDRIVLNSNKGEEGIWPVRISLNSQARGLWANDDPTKSLVIGPS